MGEIIMLLTKKDLKKYQENMRVYIPKELEKELLDIYGTLEPDEDGHFYEFTEQDIYEQLRKIIPEKTALINKSNNECSQNVK